MSNKRITDLVEKTPTIDFWIEVVDPTDLTDSPDGSSFKSKLPIGSGTPQGLQSVVDVNPNVVDSTIILDAEGSESILFNSVGITKGAVVHGSNGVSYTTTDGTGNNSTTLFNGKLFSFVNLLSGSFRKNILNFLSTGLKISSRSDGSEIGVILNTDNLTVDRTRQEQDKDGTYALVEDGYILLKGTEAGKPIIGDILVGYIGDDNFGGFGIDPTTDLPSIFDHNKNAIVSPVGFKNNNEEFVYNNTRGAFSSKDHSLNYDNFTYVQKKWVDDNFASKARRQTLVYNSGNWNTATLNRVYYISFNGNAIETLSSATLFTPTEAMQGRNIGMGIAPYNCKIKKIIFKNSGSGAYTGKLYLASGRPQYNLAFANPYTDIVIHKNENISSIAYFSKYEEFDVTDNITVAKGNVISPMLLFSAQEASKAGIYFAIEIEEVL